MIEGQKVTHEEIVAAVGRPIAIQNGEQGDGIRYFEFTASPDRGLWKCHSEEEARAGLLAEIAKRAEGKARVIFRVWPETGGRPDGKWGGYARARFE